MRSVVVFDRDFRGRDLGAFFLVGFPLEVAGLDFFRDLGALVAIAVVSSGVARLAALTMVPAARPTWRAITLRSGSVIDFFFISVLPRSIGLAYSPQQGRPDARLTLPSCSAQVHAGRPGRFGSCSAQCCPPTLPLWVEVQNIEPQRHRRRRGCGESSLTSIRRPRTGQRGSARWSMRRIYHRR